MKIKNVFYGWVIVLAAIFIMAIGIGAINSTSGVLVKPVCDELGFSRAEFSTYRTIVTLVGTFLMPLYGKLIVKYGVKKVMFICTIGIAVTTFAYSFSTHILHFYIIAFINGLVFNGISFMSIGILVRNWFTDKQGLATGLAYAGSGIGAAIMVPVVSWIVETMRWQAVFQIIGVGILMILLPIILFIVKEKPEDMGLVPYQDKNKKEMDTVMEETFAGITFKQAKKTPAFWLLMISIFLLGIMASAPNVHTVPYLTDIGYSAAYAASVVSVIMIMLTVAKIILGVFFDRFGTLVGNLFLSACCVGFPVLALVANYTGVPWIYAIFYGMASSGASIPIAILVSKYFGSREYSTIFSVFTMVSTFGTSIGAPAMGAIFDTTGSYYWAWVILFIISIIITVTLVLANKTSEKIKTIAIA